MSMPATETEARTVFEQAELIYDQGQVEQATDRMAVEITADLEDQNPVFMCVMNGGMIPLGMLLPRLHFLLRVDYLHATRYRERTYGTDLEWKQHHSLSLENETVVIVDDILDEGYTLEAIKRYCMEAGARQVLSAVLVEKEHDRGADYQADYVGLLAPDRYLFGYGMDYKGYWRNANGIFALKDG